MNTVRHFLGSSKCFFAVMLLFVIESVWVAVTLNYPAIFDEGWHVGIIRQYAMQWSPLLTHQPPDTYNLGALTRDPSFVFHYLMSFPYRLIAWITPDIMTQVITLRFIDIALFATALIIFRSLLLKVKASPAIVNTTMFFFVLVPVVPFLAAQINYDDLLMPLTALSLLLTLQFRERLLGGTFDTIRLVLLLAVAMLASVTQFEFLPICLAIVVYLGFIIRRYSNYHNRLLSSIAKGWTSSTTINKILVTTIFVIATILFAYSYGVNLVMYHTPTPSCNKVLTTSDCLKYYAFNRNYTDIMTHLKINPNPLLFTVGWVYRLLEYSFYTALNLPNIPYQVLPLPLPSMAAISVFLFGAILVWRYRKKISQDYPGLIFLVAVSMFYILALWVHNYSDFITIGVKVGINGRYLFPIILPIMLTIGIGFQYFLKHRIRLKLALLLITALFFLEGGGSILYIVSSDPTWWWPGHSWVTNLAQGAKDVIKPIIVNFKFFR